jgi:hypothetical protein
MRRLQSRQGNCAVGSSGASSEGWVIAARLETNLAEWRRMRATRLFELGKSIPKASRNNFMRNLKIEEHDHLLSSLSESAFGVRAK